MNRSEFRNSCSNRPIGQEKRQNTGTDPRVSATFQKSRQKPGRPETVKKPPGGLAGPAPKGAGRKAEADRDEERFIGSILFLCIVLCLSFMLTIRASKFIEKDFSEKEGIGAAVKTLKELILQNEEIAAFLGLDGISKDGEDTPGSQETEEEEEQNTDSETQRKSAIAIAVQKYIEAHNAKNTATAGIFPLDGPITSHFSARENPFYQVGAGEERYEFHNGLDISAAKSTDILAYNDGFVTLVTDSPSYGNYLIITHEEGFQTLYAHCEKIRVKEGDFVKQGQHIAVAGSTGRSTARHLHFEIRIDGKPVNPLPYLPKRSVE